MLEYTKEEINKAVVDKDKEALYKYTRDVAEYFINRDYPKMGDELKEDTIYHCITTVLKLYDREKKNEPKDYRTYLTIIIKSSIIWYNHKMKRINP